MTRATRIETALQLRGHALAILRQNGSYRSAGKTKFLMWRGDWYHAQGYPAIPSASLYLIIALPGEELSSRHFKPPMA